jgi:hypothetical protein
MERDGMIAIAGHQDGREGTKVSRRALIGFFGAAFCLSAVALAGEALAASATRLWNLTSGTIKEFRLAAAGTTNFGKNQCENDKDGTVDHDERLPIIGVASGRYDAKIVYVSGKTCTARDLEIKEGKVFQIDDHDLKGCK